MYIEKCADPEKSYILAKKGFELLKKKQEKKSFFVIKFLIAVEELVGLDKFTDEDYSCIFFEGFKPLFVVFLLELFWKNNLQDKYVIAHEAMEMFLKYE